ncbi:MAG: TMEM165/GDT1 family protein [Kiritimatiellia bacterium]|jgi:putative Ca2+/H+ antiporter (TMEM165/GDT1 family)
MDFKLFFSTFLVVFLAELGDKTQLTVLCRAAAADPASRTACLWTVFLAGAFALTLSTAIGVLLGGMLNRYVPERCIKLCAGGLFILMGVLILREGFVSR